MSVVDERPSSPTRQRVLRSVMARGPVSASALADELGVTPAAVRRQLDVLAAEGSIAAAPSQRSGAVRAAGRPARRWVATAAAHATVTTSYDRLAVAALEHLVEEAGTAALDRFAARRAAELEERCAPAVAGAGPAPLHRAQALAAALTADGYAARADVLPLPGAGGAAQAAPVTQVVQLCQGHCPVAAVAARYPQLCDAEAEVFARLLGAPVRRLATLAAGSHTCTTHVTSPARARPPSTEERSTDQQDRQPAPTPGMGTA